FQECGCSASVRSALVSARTKFAEVSHRTSVGGLDFFPKSRALTDRQTSSMPEPAAEMSEPRGIGMEEDALDLAFGDGQQDGGERTVVPIEDQGRLSVELPRLEAERRAARRRGHEGGHATRALERPPQVADALELATLRS